MIEIHGIKAYLGKAYLGGEKGAEKGTPFASCKGGPIALGIDADPFLPRDMWDQYVEDNESVHSFSQPVEVPYRPVTCIWHSSFDSVFTKATKEVGECYIESCNPVMAMFSEQGFEEFEEESVKRIQEASQSALGSFEVIGAAISLFGKSPALVACWKLQKAMSNF